MLPDGVLKNPLCSARVGLAGLPSLQGPATKREPFQCQRRDFVPPLGQQRESPGR